MCCIEMVMIEQSSSVGKKLTIFPSHFTMDVFLYEMSPRMGFPTAEFCVGGRGSSLPCYTCIPVLRAERAER